MVGRCARKWNVNSRTKDRLLHFLCGPALFGLALSVFVWGLEYKISLYEPPPHQIPTAKLLSRNEQVEISAERSFAELTRPMATGPTWTAAALRLLVATLNPPVTRKLDFPAGATAKAVRAKFAVLFVRPPPCLTDIE
jgi:hypothetical protein